jgi:hypothetical protein
MKEVTMAYSEVLAQRVRGVLAGEAGLEEKKMFGGIGFLIDGNMACGVSGDGLIVRVGVEAYPNAVMRPGARPWPDERPMKGWVIVDRGGIAAEADLRGWIEEGVAFARTLPAK